MAKIHLIISADPVPNGFDQVAICGDIIPKASAVSLMEMETPASTIVFCARCFRVIPALFTKTYVYILASGQDARDLEGAEP